MDYFVCAATFLAALGSGLMAGNFFAFSAFLLKAVGRLSPERGIVAMQAITAAIRSPVFLLVFFGMAILTALLGILAPFRWSEPDAVWLLLGALLYLSGAFGVTLLRNVPLNNQLAVTRADTPEGAKFWQHFQSSWSLWNHVRWVTALAAAAAFIMAMLEAGPTRA